MINSNFLKILFIVSLFLVSCNDSVLIPNNGGKTGLDIYYTKLRINNDTTSGNVQVWKFNTATEKTNKITDNAFILSEPIHGKFIVYTNESDKTGNYYFMDDSATKQLIFSNELSSTNICSDLDKSGKIIFTLPNYDFNGNKSYIYSVDVSGNSRVTLTNDAAQKCIPAVSPDQTQIAYIKSSFISEHITNGDSLFIENVDGTGKEFITVDINQSDITSALDWSPVANELITIAQSGSTNISQLVIVDAANKTRTGITNTETYKTHPLFSPNGQKIAFSEYDNGYSISIINKDGTGYRRIYQTSYVGGIPVNLAWSPDGSSILINDIYINPENPIGGYLKLMNISTGNIISIADSVMLLNAFIAK